MNDVNNIFSSSNCLSQKQLLGYIQQKLDRDEVYMIESHLNTCAFCSDAIEGLMDTDFHKLEADIKEIKPLLIQEQISSMPIKKANNHLKANKPKRNWWLAASVLLLFGIGGFSMFKYVQHQQHEVAMNNNEISKDDYKNPKPQSTEIVQLSVPADSIEELDGKSQNKNAKVQKGEENSQFQNKKEVAVTKEEKPKVVFTPPISKSTNEEMPKPQANEAQKVAVAPSETLIESQNYHDNYVQTEAKSLEKEKMDDKFIQSKKSSVGMSRNNSQNANYNRSNQMSYPANANNTDNNIVENTKNYKQKSVAKKEEISNQYETALQYYNNGNYKKAIKYFEKALVNNTNSQQKEDIQYQLAQAYLKNGDTQKAENIFNVLQNSSKYKQAIEGYLKSKK